MEGVLQTTLLTSILFLSSLLPNASSSASFSPLPMIGQESFFAVKEGDTLKTIAKDIYGSEDDVVILLEDNSWIWNPDYIEPGWQLKVRKNPLLMKQDQPENGSGLANAELASLPDYLPQISPQVQSFSVFASPTPTLQPTTPPTQPAVYSGGHLNDAQIQYLGNCEAGMDPTKNTGNGYYGAFQFSYGTWQSMGTGYERADLAPLEVQIDAVQRLLSRSSIYTQFPACALKMQSIGLI